MTTQRSEPPAWMGVTILPCDRFRPAPEWFDAVCECGWLEEDHGR